MQQDKAIYLFSPRIVSIINIRASIHLARGIPEPYTAEITAQPQARASVQAIANDTGLSRAAIYRIQENPSKAFTSLDAFGL